MQAGQGVFIAIEGSDGSGKETQFQLLTQQLVASGYDVAIFDFPQYDQPSSFFVREYLNGRYGNAEQVGPYTASLFYALDRYQVASQIRQALADGKIVLANRFVGSSMAHQGTKFYHAEERRGYFIWLDNLEFEMLRIPRPTMSFVLRVPADIAQKLVEQKAKRTYTDKQHDLHEADLDHLKRAVEVYDDMCQLFPKDFVKVDCMKGSKLQNVETVQGLLWQHIAPMLPPAPKRKKGSVTAVASPEAAAAQKPAAKTAAAKAPKPKSTSKEQYRYFVPEGLSAEVETQYRASIDQILGLYGEMVEALSARLAGDTSAKAAKADTAARARAYEALRAVLPVAIAPIEVLTVPVSVTSKVSQIAAEFLPDNYGHAFEPLQLTNVWPRNELDIIAEMLYQHSNASLKDIRTIAQGWPYERKLAVYEAYVDEQATDIEQPGSALEKLQYGWDIVSEYGVFRDVQQQGILKDLTWQPLTPRYGYEVPHIIDAAGLTDTFEACFDISLRLHSTLQAAGHLHEAQYATLYGHRMRWTASHNAEQAVAMYQQLAYPSHPAYRELLGLMLEKIAGVHPLLAESIAPEA